MPFAFLIDTRLIVFCAKNDRHHGARCHVNGGTGKQRREHGPLLIINRKVVIRRIDSQVRRRRRFGHDKFTYDGGGFIHILHPGRNGRRAILQCRQIASGNGGLPVVIFDRCRVDIIAQLNPYLTAVRHVVDGAADDQAALSFDGSQHVVAGDAVKGDFRRAGRRMTFRDGKGTVDKGT